MVTGGGAEPVGRLQATVESVFESTGVETSIIIAPLGVDLPLNVDLYPQLLRQLADGVTHCHSST